MGNRIVFLDYMRVIACFMVIIVHSCEFFYIGESGICIRAVDDGFWVSIFDSAFRCSVPLFVLISAYLLVPVTGSVGEFFKKRLTRVVVPFVIWSLLYASLPYLWGDMSGTDVLNSILRLTYNFNDASGHLWFVYMLIGLYLFMPIISPWLQKAGPKALLMFIALWFLSSFFPYLRSYVGAVYGECFWNEYNTLWYFSGFLGYVVLAYFIRNYLQWSARTKAIVGVAAYLIGYAITATVWYNRMDTATSLQELEISWRFCTPNVILEGFGAFILIEAIFRNCKQHRVITQVSNLSYGIYLMHIFILGAVYRLFAGMYSTPATILIVGIVTFILCSLLAKCLSYIPKSKYIIG